MNKKDILNIKNGLDKIILVIVLIIVLLVLHGAITYRPYYNDLINSGESVSGVITKIDEKTNMKIDGRHPVEIQYEFVKEGQLVSDSYVTIENIFFGEGDSVELAVVDGYSVVKGVSDGDFRLWYLVLMPFLLLLLLLGWRYSAIPLIPSKYISGK